MVFQLNPLFSAQMSGLLHGNQPGGVLARSFPFTGSGIDYAIRLEQVLPPEPSS